MVLPGTTFAPTVLLIFPTLTYGRVKRRTAHAKEGDKIMKVKAHLYTVLATMAFLGFLGVAEAQTAESEPPTEPLQITPELHKALTKGGTVLNGASMSSAGDAVAPPVAGWNYVHAANCQGYWDGTTIWLYVYAQEGGYWFTSSLSLQTTIAPACQTGNWLAFYVYNTNGNLWNYV
jgi:hypothetical protein